MRKWIIYILLFLGIRVCAQNADSLKLALKNAKHDTTRCNILNAMIEAESDDAIWPKYNEELKKLAEKKLSENLSFFLAKIYKKHLAASLNNIGFIYDNQGQIKKALDYYGRSLKIREESGDKKGIAQSLNNIGLIYQDQDQLKEALDHYGRSLKIQEEIGNRQGIAASLHNIGLIYQNLAFEGATANKQEQIKEALNYYSRSLKIWEEIGDKHGIAFSLNEIGLIYKNQGQLKQALDYSLRSFSLSRKIGYPETIRNASKLLSEIYELQGEDIKSLEMYKLYIQMRDSITNNENKKKAIKQQFQYEYDKKAAADSIAFAKFQEIKNIEIQKQKVELNAKRNLQYLMFGGLILVIVFAGFMYNRFRITQKQKKIIEKQKLLVEQQKLLVEMKQKEVLDSIHYAKRIQTALLPSEKYIERKLSERL